MLPVALVKAVLQQGRTTALVPMQSFDSYERQIPMRLGRPIVFRSLENGGNCGLLFRNYATCDNSLQRPIIAVNTRWQP